MTRKVILILLILTFLSKSLPAFEPADEGSISALPRNRFGELISLDEAIARSLTNHAGLKLAYARLEEEKAHLKGKYAEFLPRIGAYFIAGAATGAKDFVTYSNLYLEQPLFEGGKNVSLKNRSKTRVDIEKLKVGQTRLEIEHEIRLLYIRALLERALIEISQNEVREIMSAKGRIKNLVRRDVFTLLKLKKVKTVFQKAKSSLVEHKENYDYLISILKELIQIREDESLELEPFGEIPELKEDVHEYLNLARKNNPLYGTIPLKIKEKEYERKALEGERWPKLSLIARGNIYRDINIDTDRVILGVQGSWNIWDFGRLGSEIRAKKCEAEEEKWKGVLEIQEKEKKIRELFHKAKALKEKIKLEAREFSEKKEIYKEDKIFVAAGHKGVGEVVESFLDLEKAREEKLQIITEYRLTVIELEKLTGKFRSHSEAQG